MGASQLDEEASPMYVADAGSDGRGSITTDILWLLEGRRTPGANRKMLGLRYSQSDLAPELVL
jgi:hypothetical protein